MTTRLQLCFLLTVSVYCTAAQPLAPQRPAVYPISWSACTVSTEGKLGCFDSSTDAGGDSVEPALLYKLPDYLKAGGVHSATIRSSGRANADDIWRYVANSVCVLMESGNLRCHWVEGIGPESQSTLARDITDDLIPAGAATAVSQFCTGTNYLCMVAQVGGVLTCGSTALDAPYDVILPPALNDSPNGTSWRYPGLYDKYSTRFVSKGPFLRVDNVSAVSCGELQVCAVMKSLGGHQEKEQSQPGSGSEAGGSVTCWALQYEEPVTDLEMCDDTVRVKSAKKVTEVPNEVAEALEGGENRVLRVSTSFNLTCVITHMFKLHCWYLYGQAVKVPPALSNGGVTDVSIDGLYDWVCAISKGRLTCFGPSAEESDNLYIMPANLPQNISSVRVHEGYLCVISNSSELRCQYMDQLPGPLVPREYSVPGSNITSVATGGFHTCVVNGNGSMGCFGFDDFGQATVPSTLNSTIIKDIATGYYHSCALTEGQHLECWGYNDVGDFTVVPEGYEEGVKAVTTGDRHICVVLQVGGRLHCWGPPYTSDATAVPKKFQNGVIAASAGGNHTCAITAERELGCWGDNAFNQTDIPDGFRTEVASVSCGYMHTCVVNTKEQLRCFGWNTFQQLDVPDELSNGVGQVSAGFGHTCAFKQGWTGTLRCFGGPPDATQLRDDFTPSLTFISSGHDRFCRVALGQLDCIKIGYTVPVAPEVRYLGSTANSSSGASLSQDAATSHDNSSGSSALGLILGLMIGIPVLLLACGLLFALLLYLRRSKHRAANTASHGTSQHTASYVASSGMASLSRQPTQKSSVSNGSSSGQLMTSLVSLPSIKSCKDLDGLAVNVWVLQGDELEFAQRISAGAHGVVHLGKLNGAPVAIKCLHGHSPLKEFGEGATLHAGVRALAREVHLLTQLRSPNVVQFMGVCLDPLALVTEYCRHGSLYDMLSKANEQDSLMEKLTWVVRLKMALHCALGMQHLHHHDIVHRDLKSPNLFIAEGMQLKVGDFGVSALLSDGMGGEERSIGGGSSHHSSATPTIHNINRRWMAPEVAMGLVSHQPPEQLFTKAADVYAFGLVLLELATFRIPFPHLSTAQVFFFNSQGTLRPEVPTPGQLVGGPFPDCESFLQLMRDCCADDTTDRPTFEAICTSLRQMMRAFSPHSADAGLPCPPIAGPEAPPVDPSLTSGTQSHST